MPAIQPPPQLVSNGARPARLFYTAPRMAGVGHASYAATEPPFQHGDHGVQQLNDPSRASLLGELTDYLPSPPAAWRSPHEISHRRPEPSPTCAYASRAHATGPVPHPVGAGDVEERRRFDAMLERLQQAHMRAAIEAEIRLAAPDSVWCRDNRITFHNENSEGPPLLADVNAWTRFVRGPANPTKARVTCDDGLY
jgi:hypothetical protein